MHSWNIDGTVISSSCCCISMNLEMRYVPLLHVAWYLRDGWQDCGSRIVGLGGAELALVSKVTTYPNVNIQVRLSDRSADGGV
jgi:hypothetical protein